MADHRNASNRAALFALGAVIGSLVAVVFRLTVISPAPEVTTAPALTRSVNQTAPSDGGAAGTGETALASGSGVARSPTSSAVRFDGDMVRVDEGSFFMGCNADADDRCAVSEYPGRSVRIDAFEIDRTEVTVGSYAACVDVQVCSPPHSYAPGEREACNWGHPERSNHPVNCLTWYDAQRYCGWLGKRLPTEAEWEKAARGVDRRVFPWGDEPASCELAVMTTGRAECVFSHTQPVGTRPEGASPYGALDMAGNVEEWTADWYAPDYYANSPANNPTGPPGGQYRVARGAGYNDDAVEVRVSARDGERVRGYDDDIGFRCVRSLR